MVQDVLLHLLHFKTKFTKNILAGLKIYGIHCKKFKYLYY